MQTTTKTTDLWQTPGPAAQVESSIRAMWLYNDDNRRLCLNAPEWERFIEAANDQPSHIRTFCLTLLYGSQKEHWLGWLREYNGPGAYGRQTGKTRDAQFAFNHGQCAPMLFWLAEALEMPDARLTLAYSAIRVTTHIEDAIQSPHSETVSLIPIKSLLLSRCLHNI